jgi:hypothetical protein
MRSLMYDRYTCCGLALVIDELKPFLSVLSSPHNRRWQHPIAPGRHENIVDQLTEQIPNKYAPSFRQAMRRCAVIPPNDATTAQRPLLTVDHLFA